MRLGRVRCWGRGFRGGEGELTLWLLEEPPETLCIWAVLVAPQILRLLQRQSIDRRDVLPPAQCLASVILEGGSKKAAL